MSDHAGATPLILHIHIFKNAGTSIEQVLKRNLGDRWVSFDKPDRGAWVGQEELVAMRRDRPDLAAVSTHQFCPPLPDPDVLPVIPLLLLRNPWARLRSAYEFDRRRGDVSPHARLASELDFPDYVDEMLEQGHPMVRNPQVRQLGGTKRVLAETGTRLGDNELGDRAWEFVQSLPSVGVVERIDGILPVWEAQIREVHPDFRFFATHANRTSDEPKGMWADREALREELGPDRVFRFNQLCRSDWKLYVQTLDLIPGAEDPAAGTS